MKKKTLLLVLICALVSTMMITLPVFAGTTSQVGTPEVETIGGEEFFFANGTPITIAARTDGVDGASITWEGCTDPVLVGAEANIFGGMHNNSSNVNTSITINGGKVGYVFGGGLHKSNTLSAKIIMNGGRVNQINGGGASSWTAGCSAECSIENREWKNSDYENAPCQTKSASVTINGGTVCGDSYGLVYGGGCGYSNTEEATVTITGGDLSKTYVTAGGSNGNTTEASVAITGGTIKIVQTINRGTIESASLEVTGGTVNNLYVGGETGDSSVTGTITGSANVQISGNAKVEVMELGTNGGTQINVEDSNSIVKAEDIKVVAGTVTELKGDILENVTLMLKVTIDEKTYIIEKGKTVKDIAEYNNIIQKEGYNFKGFQTSEGEEWIDTTKIEKDVVLKTVFEKIIVKYKVEIDGVEYTIEEGKTVKDIEEYNDIIKKEGYNFKGFQTEDGKEWDETAKVEKDIILKTVFEKIQEDDDEKEEQPPVKDEEDKEKEEQDKEPVKDDKNDGKDDVPRTGVESTTITVFAVIAVMSIIGLALTSKKRK